MKRITILASIVFAVLVISNVAHAQYTKTKYPIVLVHGIAGYDTIGGVIDHFYEVPYELRRSGAKVYVPSMSAFHSTEKRAEQLGNYLMTLPEDKFNLIAHSQGAPTSRIVAALMPHKVASITSVGGVNRGSELADVILGIFPEGVSRDIVVDITTAFGVLLNFLSGADNELDALANAISLSTADAERLNEILDDKGLSEDCRSIHEDVNVSGYNIKMYSWTGDQPFTNWFDPVDYALAVTSLAFGRERNDGATSVCSAQLGKVIGDYYNMNHLDEINQMFGATGSLDPVKLYRAQANRLKNSGL